MGSNGGRGIRGEQKLFLGGFRLRKRVRVS